MKSIFLSRRKRPAELRDGKGQLIPTQTDRLARWREYFPDLLNVPGVVQSSHFDSLTPVPLAVALGEPPTFVETLAAVRRLRNGKSPGPDGLHAEVLKSLDCVNLRVLHEHITRVWVGADDMPEDWVHNYLIPIPKKGDLSYCKKWRGILLAAVPGKVFGKILNARLYRHAEKHGLLPETQAGFRAGRSCTDMILSCVWLRKLYAPRITGCKLSYRLC